jgi:hypothetical protein
MEPIAQRIRDIRLPEPDFWWPPAPGWWLLGVAMLLLVLLIAGTLYWRGRLRRAALRELKGIRNRFEQDGDGRALAMALNLLLRRVAMAKYSREEVAACHGRAWLELLDRLGGGQWFSRGQGEVLLRAPYRPEIPFDGQALLRLVEVWIGEAT